MYLNTTDRTLLAAIALSCACATPSAPAPAGSSPWNHVEWASLVPVQCALARGPADDALREAESVAAAKSSAVEQMWLHVYRGIALDRLGRRDDALRAYRDATALHAHGVATRGLRRPLYTLDHLEGMHERCGAGD